MIDELLNKFFYSNSQRLVIEKLTKSPGYILCRVKGWKMIETEFLGSIRNICSTGFSVESFVLGKYVTVKYSWQEIKEAIELHSKKFPNV